MGLKWLVTTLLQWAELIVAMVTQVVFGFFMFSSALVASKALLAVSKFLKLTSVYEDLINMEAAEENPSSSPSNLPPVVLIHGMFGFGKGRMGGFSYFGGAEEMAERVLVPDLGSLTSIHDRARELFYYLKGGRVDYGEAHSKAAGHSQFGKVYEQGNYSEWDEDHPVHFVAHSAGAQVVRVLQQMLADKAFKGHANTSPNWVLSITAISGAMNGSTRSYIEGMMPENWKCVKPVSMLELCRIAIIIYDWLDIGWMKAFHNFGFDHFNLSWRNIGFSGLIDCLMGNAGPIASGDWVLTDLTLQASAEMNSRLNTFPNTFYFSYACKKTRKIMGVTVPSLLRDLHPLFWIRSWQMCQWRFPSEVEPPYKGYRDEDWEDNDGALNTISMTYPRIPIKHPSCYIDDDFQCQPLEPGIWYYKVLEADHMLFVFNRDRAGVKFNLMYDGIFARCRRLVFKNKTSIPSTVCSEMAEEEEQEQGQKQEDVAKSLSQSRTFGRYKGNTLNKNFSFSCHRENCKCTVLSL